MEDFAVKVAPRVAGKKFNVFKMHKDDQISWAEAKMRRENENQPWQIKLGSGRTARRFKATREGGVSENASYFIFFKPKDSKGPFEVCPVDEWYSMSATQRYKTLTAEEAEQKFEQRHKTLNMFSVMHKKNGEAGEESGSGFGGGQGGGGGGGFKISEMDDWDQSGDDSGNSEFGDEDEATKKKRRRATKKEKEEPENAPDEGKEDSDEGDFEQREVDYMSDSSSESEVSESGAKDEADVKGIAEEEALRDLLSSDEDDDARSSPRKDPKLNLNKNSLGTVDLKQSADGNNSEDSSDSDDYDVDEDKMDSMFAKKPLPVIKQEVKTDQPDHAPAASTVRIPPTIASITQQTNKREPDPSPASSSSSISPPTKRPCPTEYASSSPITSFEKTIEDLLRKYLSRKPVTTKALLKDIKSKLRRQGRVTPEMDNNLLSTLATVIRRLNPERQKIGDTIYLSLKS